jgi:NADH-quinone oxidoreductase subunit G
MVNSTGNTWLLWDLEPQYDIDNPALAAAALQSAEKVLAVTSFASDSLKQVADVLLPLAPLAESEGSLVNLDGNSIAFAPAGKVLGEARPGWKILRRLGGELGLEGFGQVSLMELQSEMNAVLQAKQRPGDGEMLLADPGQNQALADPGTELHRVGEVPMYSVDALCRRATSLQKTVHARSEFVGLNPADAGRLGLSDQDQARVSQGGAVTELEVHVSEVVPEGAAWVRSATGSAQVLGSATGPISVELA